MSYIAFLESYFWFLVLLVNILVYLCGVRARRSANLFTRRAICLQDGEGSNNNDNLAFPRGGPERGNPAMTTKRLRQGVKETHQHKCCGKYIWDVEAQAKWHADFNHDVRFG